MARRRRFLERPHDHLQRAAEAHARITSGEPADDEQSEQAPPAPADSEQSQRASAQRRNQEGRFA